MSQKSASPRLGRGLSTLLGEAFGSSDNDVRTIAIDKLSPGTFQPRRVFAPEALAELTDSIRNHGILQPLLARPHPVHDQLFQIIGGERRWRAAQAAGLHSVPVLLRRLTDAEAMAASLVENLQREDLDPIEEADGYQRLAEEFHLTQDDLGKAVGKSRSHVANMMRLIGLPSSVRTELQKRNLSAGHARALLSHPDPAKAALIVISRGLNVRQTEEMVRKVSTPSTRRAAQVSPEATHVGQQLSGRLGLKVEVSFAAEGGQVRIYYKTLDQLDGLMALLSG